MIKLPHWIFPYFWGLKGKLLEKAKIEYYETDPYIKEKKLLDLEISDSYERACAKFNLAFSKNYEPDFIDWFWFHFKREPNLDSDDKDIYDAYNNYLNKDITKRQLIMLVKNRSNQPFVDISDSKFNEQTGELELEYIYNKEFIEYLKKAGYTGLSDEDIIDHWIISTVNAGR